MDKVVGQVKDKIKPRKGSSNQKSGTKRKSKGETCSLFLSQMIKKLRAKKKSNAQSSSEVVRSVLDSITESIPVQTATTSAAKKKATPKKVNQLLIRSADNSAVKKTLNIEKVSSKQRNSNNISAAKIIQSPTRVTHTPVSALNSRYVKKINPDKESHMVPSTDSGKVSLTLPTSDVIDIYTSLPNSRTLQKKGLEPAPFETEFKKSNELEIIKLDTNETMVIETDIEMEVFEPISKGIFAVPCMPLVNSDLFKRLEEKQRRQRMNKTTEDVASNTTPQRDATREIIKHVETLRKISVIAEEFNKKTAKNLMEIIQSVQLDLLKKLDEVSKEEIKSATASAMKDILIKE